MTTLNDRRLRRPTGDGALEVTSSNSASVPSPTTSAHKIRAQIIGSPGQPNLDARYVLTGSIAAVYPEPLDTGGVRRSAAAAGGGDGASGTVRCRPGGAIRSSCEVGANSLEHMASQLLARATDWADPTSIEPTKTGRRVPPTLRALATFRSSGRFEPALLTPTPSRRAIAMSR